MSFLGDLCQNQFVFFGFYFLTAGAISADIGVTVRAVMVDVFEGVKTKGQRATRPTAEKKHEEAEEPCKR